MSGKGPLRVLPELSLHERRSIRARVRWLGHQSGWAEIEVLALVRLRAQATDRLGLTDAHVRRLQALDQLLSSEIDLVGN